MTDATAQSQADSPAAPAAVEAPRPRRPLPLALLKLARPHQWSKSVFVLLGPLYGIQDKPENMGGMLAAAFVAAGAFALASSACYVINDLMDAPRDRLHPRKRHRPIAAGEVSKTVALVYAAVLSVLALALVLLLNFASGVLLHHHARLPERRGHAHHVFGAGGEREHEAVRARRLGGHRRRSWVLGDGDRAGGGREQQGGGAEVHRDARDGG
jgi:hypothetical protein